MEFVEQLKNRIGRYLLHQEIKHHPVKRQRTSFVKALDIGILYHGSTIQEEQLIHKYADALREEGKKVFLMGYVDEKLLPGNKKFSLQSEYYWKEKLTPFNLPDPGKIGRFTTLSFDFLLTIYSVPLLPVLALSALSKAKYRVGPQVKDALNYFDGVIDTGSKPELSHFIGQMDFYLKAIG